MDSKLDAQATAFGERLRRTLHRADESSGMHMYANYAHGDETLEELYGHDPWRVAWLKQLKDKWDPMEKFEFYAPIQHVFILPRCIHFDKGYVASDINGQQSG